MRKHLIILSIFVLYTGNIFAQQLNLDAVIERSARDIENVLQQGAKVAILSFDSPAKAFSDHVIEELTGELVNSRKVTIVDRRNLALISQEMNLQLSGDVSDESAQAIGRMLGAQSIVSGSLTNMGTFHRFRIRVINVETAAIQSQISLNLQNDSQVAFLLGGNSTPSVVTVTPTVPTPSVATVSPTVSTPTAGTSLVNQQVLSWQGVWMRIGENKYTSPTINHNQSTWETLTINAPSEGVIIRVRFSASSEGSDYGYATVIDGSKSITSTNIIARISGTETRTVNYSIPPGRHQIHFGYGKDGSVNDGDDNVTVEVTVIQQDSTSTPTTVTSLVNQQALSWQGVWMRTGENKYTSPTINHNQSTWETLTINSPSGGTIIRVRFSASSEGADYGYATVINGSKSTSSSNIIAKISGTETRTVNYSIPPGRHQIHFGYGKDGSVNDGDDNVTVEVTVIQ